MLPWNDYGEAPSQGGSYAIKTNQEEASRQEEICTEKAGSKEKACGSEEKACGSEEKACGSEEKACGSEEKACSQEDCQEACQQQGCGSEDKD
jgi:hypothetical protein